MQYKTLICCTRYRSNNKFNEEKVFYTHHWLYWLLVWLNDSMCMGFFFFLIFIFIFFFYFFVLVGLLRYSRFFRKPSCYLNFFFFLYVLFYYLSMLFTGEIRIKMEKFALNKINTQRYCEKFKTLLYFSAPLAANI